MKPLTLLIALLSALLAMGQTASGQTIQPPAYFEDITGKVYASYSVKFANPVTNSIVCATQFGSVNAPVSLTTDKGDVFLRATGFWDSNARQGVAIFYLIPATPGAQTVTEKTNGNVQYVSLSCNELKLGPMDVAKSADAAAVTLGAAAADTTYTAIIEDQSGNGDSFTIGSGFTFSENDGAHAFADAIGTGNPAFTVNPSRNTLVAAVAFQPPPTSPQPVQFAVPGLGTATFPLTGPQVSQLYCAAADGVCSIQIRVCDANVPPNCLTSGAGSLSLVKTATLPVPQTTATVLATVKAAPPTP